MAKDKDQEQPEQPSNLENTLASIATALQALTAMQAAQMQKSESSGQSDVQALITTLAPALARLAEAQVEAGKMVASETRRAHRPSNEVVPQISVFNRRGVNLSDLDPSNKWDAMTRKPKLKCLIMCPWLIEWESCTREEVMLLNLVQPGDYTVKKIDNSRIRVDCRMDYKVDGKTPSRMIINHETAFNNDNHKMMPPLTEMLRQILKQTGGAEPTPEDLRTRAEGAAVLTDEEEEALIEAGELSVSV